MTTTQAPQARTAPGEQLSASGIVRSEWIKLRTVRSSMWCYGLLIAAVVGIGVLIASLADLHNGALASGAPTVPGAGIAGDAARRIVVGLNTGGLHVAVLIVAVLGCLIITGEYSTGMIRSTFAAAPRRTGALIAKAIVLAASTFIATTAGIWLSAIVTWPILSGKHVAVELGQPSVFLPLLGGALYITMIALLAFGFGTILKSTAGALATVLGLILVAPVILELLSALTHAKWVSNVSALLPQNAGSHLFEYKNMSAFGASDSGGWTLNGWEGFGVLLAWLVVVLSIALIRVKRRDA
jgi:ABC-2 type transport system permease protein